jgi:hypothetical protein
VPLRPGIARSLQDYGDLSRTEDNMRQIFDRRRHAAVTYPVSIELLAGFRPPSSFPGQSCYWLLVGYLCPHRVPDDEIPRSRGLLGGDNGTTLEPRGQCADRSTLCPHPGRTLRRWHVIWLIDDAQSGVCECFDRSTRSPPCEVRWRDSAAAFGMIAKPL